MEVILYRLGEVAIFQMGAARVLTLLIPLKAKQIVESGGQEAWDRLSEVEKAATDTLLVRVIGQHLFDDLPKTDQDRLTRFIRTGCCMHKDLNSVKGGDKAMQDMWKEEGLTPPILLTNKENATVLANATNSSEPSATEKRAEEVSKRGGSHATMLGGMICQHKEKKKGQQHTYNWYMEVHIGHRVPYPDVSNTQYGSHGEAAGTIVMHHEHFIRFLKFVRDLKDKVGFTNIELNFLNALKNKETLTELCMLALYNAAVSRPFMQHVCLHENLLELGPFFQKKVEFLESISRNPKIWTGNNLSDNKATLGGNGWDEWGLNIVNAVHKFTADLPNLDKAVTAFVNGAKTTFSERFSDEFKAGGDIDTLTDTEQSALYFASTNDINEGSLGRWRLGQRRHPAEMLHKFNAAFTTGQNDTEEFIKHKLTEKSDQDYLIKTARMRDESGMQTKLKEEQMQADAEKVSENREKEAK